MSKVALGVSDYNDTESINYAIRLCKYEQKGAFKDFIEAQKAKAKSASSAGPGKWYGSLKGLLREGFHLPAGKVPEDEVHDLLEMHELLLPDQNSGEQPPLIVDCHGACPPHCPAGSGGVMRHAIVGG